MCVLSIITHLCLIIQNPGYTVCLTCYCMHCSYSYCCQQQKMSLPFNPIHLFFLLWFNKIVKTYRIKQHKCESEKTVNKWSKKDAAEWNTVTWYKLIWCYLNIIFEINLKINNLVPSPWDLYIFTNFFFL